MVIERTMPATLANMSGYNHVVKDGDTVYMAGQLARNNAGDSIGKGIFKAQRRYLRTFRQLLSQLAAT